MDQAKSDEAGFLREELAENKKLIFERPLLIVGALFVADALADVGPLELTLAMVALCWNLWFTVNRLGSSARILAYLQLVHDPGSEFEWVGWETALRLYRFYGRGRGPTAAEVWRLDTECRHLDSRRFYGGIFSLHAAILAVFLFVLASRLGLTARLPTQLQGTIASVLGIVVVVATLVAVLIRLEPQRHRAAIDKERSQWLEVFRKYLPRPKGETEEHEPPTVDTAAVT